MTQQELTMAKDPDLRASMVALKRAAELARKTAMQTNTGIVVARGEHIVHISAAQLRAEKTP